MMFSNSFVVSSSCPGGYVRRHAIPADEWQYGNRSSDDVRGTLLQLVLEFALVARTLRGVNRIALVGSLATEKSHPKDADLLVSIAEDVDFDTLARIGRRFQGRAQGMNSTADIFLATAADQYIGRVCHYRECHPRVLCRARHCGARPHLNDDLDILMLEPEVVAAPPVILHPTVSAMLAVPADVESLLLKALRVINVRWN
jgi:predicted nucleotidyltransferase